MADLVTEERGHPPRDSFGQFIKRRWKEIREGEFAPEIAVGGTVDVKSPAPLADNVLGGYRNTTGTVITVPAGRTWKGKIGANVSVRVAPTSTSVGQARAQFALSGTGAKPLVGTVMAVDAIAGPNSATGSVSSQSANAETTDMTITAAGVPALLEVTVINSGTGSSVDAWAHGELLPV